MNEDSEHLPHPLAGAHEYELALSPWLWDGLLQSDIAHVLELLDIALIDQPTGAALLRPLLDLILTPPRFADLDPDCGDLVANREKLVRSAVGDAAGYLRLGRTRREALRVAARLAFCSLLLDAVQSSADLQLHLVELATAHTRTVLPDYTYMQLTEPTTLGHYLAAAVQALGRGASRLMYAHDALNASPAGVGAASGSALPFDRERIARRLGFATVIFPARDAMWQTDTLLEAAAAATIAAEDLSRMAEDWQIWATEEFGFLRLDEAYSRESQLLPQKRNPYPLIFIRGVAGSLIGRLTAVAALVRTPTAQTDNYVFGVSELLRSLDLLVHALRLMVGVVGSLQLNEHRMRQRADQSFGFAGRLAEMLSLKLCVDYSTAHRLVAASLHGMRPGDISAVVSSLASHVQNSLGQQFGLSPSELSELTAVSLPATHRGLGGSESSETERILSLQFQAARRLKHDTGVSQQRRSQDREHLFAEATRMSAQ